MNDLGVVFNAMVVLTFVAQVFNYGWFHAERGAPMSFSHRLLFLGVLAGYCVTESILAMLHPVYWLYVLLNVWGIVCLWRGKP